MRRAFEKEVLRVARDDVLFSPDASLMRRLRAF